MQIRPNKAFAPPWHRFIEAAKGPRIRFQSSLKTKCRRDRKVVVPIPAVRAIVCFFLGNRLCCIRLSAGGRSMADGVERWYAMHSDAIDRWAKTVAQQTQMKYDQCVAQPKKLKGLHDFWCQIRKCLLPSPIR